MCARLAKVNTLPQEVPGYILKGFTRCLVVEFRDIHGLLNTADKVHQMRAVTGKRNSKGTLASVVKLCSEANDVFHSLNLMNKWNIPQGHWADAFGIVCFNCDSPDHTSDKCPHPRDEAKITKAKEAFPSLLAKDAALVVVVVDGAMVMVMVDVGVTKIILGESGVLPKVRLSLPVQIHLWVMESNRGTKSG